MERVTQSFFLMILLSVLGSCERVKDKEAVADLPQTSVEDTLVVTPDTVEIDTSLTETDYTTYEDTEEMESEEGSSSGTNHTSASSSGSVARSESQPVGNTVASSNAGRTSSSKTSGATPSKAAIARKPYKRPTQRQLQLALAQDARRSNQMSLAQLKTYWQRRQHYYKRASKEVKYVAGDTKIKISQEETKIETKLGKVKMEGNDIKVKYD